MSTPGNFFTGTNTGGDNLVVTDATTTNNDVRKIIVSAGTITDSTGHTVTVTTGGGAGAGDFVGPAASTDEAVVRFDGATGKLGQNSVLLVTDAGAVSGVTDITMTGNLLTPTSVTASGAITGGTVRDGAGALDFSATGGEITSLRSKIMCQTSNVAAGDDVMPVAALGEFLINVAAGPFTIGDDTDGLDFSDPIYVGGTLTWFNNTANPVEINTDTNITPGNETIGTVIGNGIFETPGVGSNVVITIPPYTSATFVYSAANTLIVIGNVAIAV